MGAPVGKTAMSGKTHDSGADRPGVFICYRHKDSPYGALRVEELLSRAFGEDRIFMSPKIPPGANFVDWIRDRIAPPASS